MKFSVVYLIKLNFSAHACHNVFATVPMRITGTLCDFVASLIKIIRIKKMNIAKLLKIFLNPFAAFQIFMAEFTSA